MLRFETAGESHGECLVTTVTGLPAGVPISIEFLNRQLWRRQQGYGRGGRMKIETDQVHIVSGVRHSKTIGSPIAILIENRDWKNWTSILPVEAKDAVEGKEKPLQRPRPGHADLAGVLKYNFAEARYILERASARETAARVAAGALAKTFLKEFNIDVLSHVIGVGPVRLERRAEWEEIVILNERDEVLLGCVDAQTEEKMKEAVDHAYHRIEAVPEAPLRRHCAARKPDWRDIEPELHDKWDDISEIAELDVQRGDEEGGAEACEHREHDEPWQG